MIYAGTSGYYYTDWRGKFYPKTLEKYKWIDYYAQNFNALEINVSFYRMLEKDFYLNLAKQTEYKMKICVKANRDITHTNINKSDISSNLYAAHEFQKSLVSIVNENWFGVILFQFPFSFKFNEKNFEKLKNIFDRFENFKSVIEFRHDSWLSDKVFKYLKDVNIGFCNVDTPEISGLFTKTKVVTSDIGYVRFHGRNKEQWWTPADPSDRYEYLYSNFELAKWVPILRKIKSEAKDVYIFNNNHKNGNAAVNAKYFMKKYKLQPAIKDIQLSFDF